MDPSACEERERERERESLKNSLLFSVCTSEEEWDRIIASLGYDQVKLRDTRYDQVIHMTTAANGAESFYQLSNNATRTETKEVAIERDKRLAHVTVDFVHDSSVAVLLP